MKTGVDLMIIVQICIGSSCHLKGSQQIVEFLRRDIEKYHLEDEVVLTGNLCIGKCNRDGVTVQVDDDIYTGISSENYAQFFSDNIFGKVGK